MSYKLYWGDLHSHSSISYGHGTVEQALARARAQLDFCSITGHAFWPDIPRDRARYGEIIDYHREGFARLARNWPDLLAKQQAGSREGEFLALPSYEWHSLRYGDYNVYAKGPELELTDAADLPALQAMSRERGAIVVPHHIGYAAGYRGVDWRTFSDDVSPLVEIFSLHGCSESDAAPYPMLHDMGPRDFGGTAEAGWTAGHRFGVVGGTDHHGSYPGSHGDGRMGVFASELSRESLWEAFGARRVFAATGDRIDARLWVDDAWIGSSIVSRAARHVRVSVCGCDALDRVEVLKNGRILRRLFAQTDAEDKSDRYRLRIAWGWGRKDEPVAWQCALALSEGTIRTVETCFSGQAVAAPQGVAGHTATADEDDLPHAVTSREDRRIQWRSVTRGNPTMRHPATQALSLEVEAPVSARLTVEANGASFAHALGELRYAARAHYLRGWLSEAMRIGPLVPLTACRAVAEFDDQPEQATDVYRLRAGQYNGQWVWLTPVWVDR